MNEWYDWYASEYGDAPTADVHKEQYDKVLEAMHAQCHRAYIAVGFSQAGGDYVTED